MLGYEIFVGGDEIRTDLLLADIGITWELIKLKQVFVVDRHILICPEIYRSPESF